MGVGSSTEQRPEQPEAESAPPAEPAPSTGDSLEEAAPSALGDPAVAVADTATKPAQQLAPIPRTSAGSSSSSSSDNEDNRKQAPISTGTDCGLLSTGLRTQDDVPQTFSSGRFVYRDLRGGPKAHVVSGLVGQRESEDVSEKDSAKEMTAKSATVQDITEDKQEETPEIIEQIPSSESNLEELTQPTESQSNDVGFKKVFKFVGFKFTVKKDKSEKSENVQLLTVKKDEAEGAGGSNGAGDHQESSLEAGEEVPKESELKQSTEKPEETVKSEQGNDEITLKAESEQALEEVKEEGEEKREKEPSKSPESPASPVTNETASPFKKFFTQGWAGWRKKTSFRKPKEDELEATEKKKEQEPEKVDAEENGKTEDTSEKPSASEQPDPQESRERVNDARLSAEYEKIELPCEDQVNDLQAPSEERVAPLATEVFDEKVEIVAEVHVSTEETTIEEQKAEVEDAAESLPPEKSGETNAEPQEAEPVEELVKTEEVRAPGEDHTQLTELSPEEKVSPKHPEGIVSEVEVLSAQERTKVQGSPLKKLFTSTGLKKLSGKKQKGRRGGGEEESGEHSQVPPESPDSTDEQKGDSSASSPEEPEDITCLEKGVADVQQDGEVEEGITSDGEKKREGVTPWASFKKMVTPKKRVRRPSESDKEDELDKAKSATLSSTESAASEMQEEIKGNGEEQKLEEPKRKVDTSVSWEALICVGSSKKRARKASSSDEEGGPKTVGGDSQKTEEAGRDKETGMDCVPANSQEHDQVQGSSSPEQAGSPSEGEGVSTWESFKRLVTARKKSKSKLEEKSEDSVTGSGIEHSASDIEPGKEESWVSIKKFIPGRRKKRLDGKQEQATVEDTGPTEVNEDDSDVPAVVPLSEYDAVEREKIEAQQALEYEEKPEQKVAVYVSEELSKSLVHTVTVTVVDGTRAVTSIEERSPSWISASVTEPLEQAEDEAKPTDEALEGEVTAEEVPVVTKTLPESKDASDDMTAGEVELTSEVVTAVETTEAFCAEEVTEASGAEETTEMISAVSQLTDSPDTTEEATPVQEVEGDVPDLAGLERRTQEVLQAVAEKVKEESQLSDSSGPEDTTQATQKVESKIPGKVEEAQEDSKVLDLKKELDTVLKEDEQETETEDLVQGKATVQTPPESSEKVPQVPESVESSGFVSTSPAETLVGVKSQEITTEQAVAHDSVETFTDNETNGSTPVGDFETLDTAQQDKIKEIHEDGEGAPCIQSELTEAEAVPAQEEMSPLPSSFQSQEESREQSKMEEVLEHTDKEVAVEAVPVLSKTEVIQEIDQFADEKTKDISFAEGLEVSTDTETTVSQKQITEVVLEDEVTEEADFHKNAASYDDIELRSHSESLPTPVDREMVVPVEREKTESQPTQVSEEKLEQKTVVTRSEELSKQAAQTVNVTVAEGENEVTSFEESTPPCLVQEEAVSTEVQVQSSDTSLTLTVATIEEKVVGETIKMLETGTRSLESAEAHLVPEEKPADKDEVLTAQSEEDAGLTGTVSQAPSPPVRGSASPEDAASPDLEGEKTTSQKWKPDEGHEEVGCQEGKESMTREEDSKAEQEVLEIESESSKLVQNVVQTAVDQLVSTEAATAEVFTSDLKAQTQVTQADNQETGQETEKEESGHQASVQDDTQSIATKEDSEAATVEPTHPDVSTDVSEGSEKLIAVETESSSVNDQQPLEAIIHPSEEKRDAVGTKPVPEDQDNAVLGERIDKSPFESKGAEKGDAAGCPENQNSALEDTDASGDLTKESPDTNGPKLKKKDDIQAVERKVHSESEKELRTQPQEDIHKQERKSAKLELTESADSA
ncbi:A-kinase anchor protein 12 [Orycteropus afer afer]|uniref:A-kinase anchor protein 12 n=1 Tax=Orycteropus afer afer TaxID=1230840 RepID=A0A8B7A0F1_ORYAF|nr:A-kinase anchor protein 12 [Orycteropus afer afer]